MKPVFLFYEFELMIVLKW